MEEYEHALERELKQIRSLDEGFRRSYKQRGRIGVDATQHIHRRISDALGNHVLSKEVREDLQSKLEFWNQVEKEREQKLAQNQDS